MKNNILFWNKTNHWMNGKGKGKKQIINWWTDQIFVYPSIMCALRIDLKKEIFSPIFTFILYFIYDFFVCVMCMRARTFGHRHYDHHQFCEWISFQIWPTFMWFTKFYFNNQHSINFGLMFGTEQTWAKLRRQKWIWQQKNCTNKISPLHAWWWWNQENDIVPFELTQKHI